MLNLLTFCGAVFILGTAVSGNTAPHKIECDGEPDGLHEIGCWGYANCVNGQPDVHACPVGTVLERESMQCMKPGEGKTDCYLTTECVGKADGSYADYGDNCVTYYRCQNELNLGRFYCPAQTAFNEALQLCDYPRNLPHPCGTKGGTMPPPKTDAPTNAPTNPTTNPPTGDTSTDAPTTEPPTTTAGGFAGPVVG